MINLDLLLWGVRSLSIFNTIAFVWLGLTVLLNAQERRPVTWVIGLAQVGAGLFFAVHSTLVGREMGSFEADLAFWWPLIWPMFVLPAFLWYLVATWYTGTLESRIQRVLLAAVALLGVAALALMAVPDALPSYQEALQGPSRTRSWFWGIPSAVLFFPAYSTLCFALALATLYRPGASRRFMGYLARRRARPWLAAATVVLVGVSVSVGGVLGWILYWARYTVPDLASPETASRILFADAAVSALLALAVVLLGRAVVSYEIFTGRALPRGGLLRHWRNSLILAAGYGVLMGGSLGLAVEPIYRLMLATLLVAIFYALLSWRSYVERERGVEQLRPFVASERLYERLVKATGPLDVDVEGPFRALCGEVLGARLAYLIPLGSMAPLVEKPLSYPARLRAPLAEVGALTGLIKAPEQLTAPVDPARFGGASWAVGLWSERGLIGALLLGEKRDGGLYVQEEIEVARSAGERLIDLQAGAEMGRRLMAVQRQRLAESQLLDRQARRVLHDDVLPQLHTAILELSAKGGTGGGAVESLAAVHGKISDLLRSMPGPAAPELGRLGLLGALRGVVERELSGAFDGVDWAIEPEAERRIKELAPLTAEVIYGAAREAIRNAARHGRGNEPGRSLHLTVSALWRSGLEIRVEDDGIGVETEKPEASGGQGLALHGTMIGVIGGTMAVEAAAGGGTRVTLSLPEEGGGPVSG